MMKSNLTCSIMVIVIFSVEQVGRGYYIILID